MNGTNTEFLSRLNTLWHFMSAVDLQNVDELCRLCMSKEDGLIPIFYKSSSLLSNDLSKWIFDCTSVKVYIGDGLPSRICQQCYEQLQHWAEFKQRCQEINITLHGCLDKSKLEKLEVSELLHNESQEPDDVREDEQLVNEDGENEVEYHSIPVEPSLVLPHPEEAPSDDSDKLIQKLKQKAGIIVKAVVLGDKQNSQTNQNDAEGPCICLKCGDTFKTKQHLQEHEISHSSDSPFYCAPCQRSFTKQKYLDFHLRYHSGENNNACETCGKKFTTMHKLSLHKRVHTGERPYECSVCHKAFPHKKSLSKHMYTHTKEKPFPCSVCSRGFADKWHLTQHFRLHTGEKPYCCSVCGQRFTHNVSLKEHFRHHTGEMWHCKLCPKKYLSKSSLTAHYKNVHRE